MFSLIYDTNKIVRICNFMQITNHIIIDGFDPDEITDMINDIATG